MRKTLIHIICLATLLQTFSCKKDKTVYQISGTLIDSCDGQPSANERLILDQDNYSTLYYVPSIKLETVTDINGNFTFTYQNDTGWPFVLSYVKHTSGSDDVLEWIPCKKNLALGTVQIKNYSDIYTYLDVQNNYSINDTLYLWRFNDYSYGSTEWKIPGPFVSGFIDTAIHNQILQTIRFEPEAPYINRRIVWKLNYNGNQNMFWITLNPCDTTHVTIPIN